jgi:TPR repeat protein
MINRSVAEQWQRRSVALGLTRAKLGLVKKFLLADTYVIRDKKKFDEAHQLLLDVLEAGDERARPELFSLLAVSGSKEQRTWAHDTLVPYLLQEEDVTTQRILALNLAFIYENGEGAPISYALARAWKQRARELDEDNNNSPDISRHIVGVLNKFTWSGMRATLHNWLHKEDLMRRIATGQVYAPEGFEP